ncbi:MULTISPECIES: hypothetical protein [Flavobacteriaceae]|uniref:hypothetical protein n=1 Tax=Flavobacteriaceae TaxID=49546 RepID=UPI001491ECEB|nr:MULTISPECIES: hypothetical protein [Allomuricauda]MDC6364823.1 hypothetical protein [Muricauda sp. AC10]
MESLTLEKWLTEIGNSKNFSEEIKALNFGLFEIENGYGIYLIGSREYDENDEDWATNEDFVPKNKYFYVKQTEKQEWEEFQKDTRNRILDYLDSKKEDGLIFNRVGHITIGFDDGNLNSIK